ncbi:MAG: MBL fold metallo-hydrolase [Pseudomonadota bacterium]
MSQHGIDAASSKAPDVQAFFDEPTNTLSYLVVDAETRCCAVVDSVLNLDYASGTIRFEAADDMISTIRQKNLSVQWILETHVHADHLSAAPYIQQQVGGRIAISEAISKVQHRFGDVFGAGEDFHRDGSQFDVLLADGDAIDLGGITGRALTTPGHTPACMSFVIGDCVFVGDTLFMPDGGTARADFPGGDARTLFQSIQRILSLPREFRMFVCHDYLPSGRRLAYETTVGEQRDGNIHVATGTDEEAFVTLRERRDATLSMPSLILPSLQVNMRAGHVPPPDSNRKFFLKLPLNAFGGPDLQCLQAREA